MKSKRKIKKLFCLFIVMTMLFTMLDAGLVISAVESVGETIEEIVETIADNVNDGDNEEDFGDDNLGDDDDNFTDGEDDDEDINSGGGGDTGGTGGDNEGGENEGEDPDVPKDPEDPEVPVVPSYDVTTAEELAVAIANKEPVIRITADFNVDRTFYITQDTYIYTDEKHTLTRDSLFAGDMFVIGQDSEGNLTEDGVVFSFGKAESKENDLLVIDGNKDYMAVDVVGSVIFVCKNSQADLYDNLTVTNCKKIGNERALDEKHGMTNTNYVGGAVGVAAASSIINIFGGKYTNNDGNTSSTSGYGGAFWNYAVMNVYGGLFENNTATRGGVFYNYRKLYIYNAVIKNNSASTNGGAIYSPKSTGAYLYLGGENEFAVSSVLFKGNTADNGGAIYSAGRFFGKDTVFEENTATDEKGGAIYTADDYNVVELEKCEFNSNTAVYGGAIYTDKKTTYDVAQGFKAKNLTFTGNTSSKSGAALYVINGVVAYLEHCNFNDNDAATYGGAIYVNGSEIEIDRANFTGNEAYNGGALFLESDSKGTFNGITVSENIASTNGGALYTGASEISIYNSRINSNQAKTGSAVYLAADATASIYKTDFIENSCYSSNTGNAAAIFGYTGGGEVVVHSCNFLRNTSSGAGGAMLFSNKTQAYLYNVTAIGNSAAKGGVLYTTTTGTVTNISGLRVSGNTATTGGPIVWGNSTGAKLYLNKANYKDLDITGTPDSSYWTGTFYANSLKFYETDLAVPGYTDYTEEDMSTLWDSFDVANLTELEDALTKEYKLIRIKGDIIFDRTLYVTRDVTLFTTDDYKFLRADNFTGDMIVVGEDKDGNLCEDTVKLTLGNSTSETKDLFIVDGNINSDKDAVWGSAIYVTGKGQVDIYDNVTFENNKNNGKNSRNEKYEDYENIGGSAIMIAEEGIVNVNGGAFRNNEGLKGGAIFNLGTLNIADGIFEKNTAEYGGAIYNVSAMNVQGGIFKENSAVSGGAVYNVNVITVKGAQFESNTATNGGAIYGETGTIDVNSDVFYKNVATENGGAIYVADGNFTSYDVEFNENSAVLGGALYISDKETINATLTSTTFNKNKATNGGAAYVMADGTDISDCSFIGNNSTENGAGIYLSSCKDIMIISATAEGNKAKKNGGFIYAEGAKFILRNGKINENDAEYGGGIAADKNSEVSIVNTEFIGNTAEYGAGMATFGGSVNITVTGSKFAENNALYGGAVYVNEGAVEISGTEFNENIADLDGGAFFLENAKDVVLFEITADGNSAGNDGGFLGAVFAEFKVFKSTVKNNEAGFDGGVFMLGEGTSSGVYNTEISGNSALRNGGVSILRSSGKENIIHSSVIKDNSALKNGGVIYAEKKGVYSLYSSQFVNNTAKTASILYITDNETTVTLNGAEVSESAYPLIWGASEYAVVNINKGNFTDSNASGELDEAYFKKAIVNKLKVNEISDDIPAGLEYGNESAGSLGNAVSVYSAEELEAAINAEEKHIRIAADFEIDRTFYITSDITIFSTTPKKLTRAADFGGDIFVIGEYADGKNAMIKDADACLTLGNPSSETPDLLVIDGNKENMTADVTGTVLFICHGAQVNIYANVTFENCHKIGNERAHKEIYVLSRPNRIGGSVGIVANGLLNVYGGTFKNNSVREETSSEEEDRNSTLGGVFYNDSNIRIYDGLFEGNVGARGGIVYNYCGMKILGGTFQNNNATGKGGIYYSPNSASTHLIIGSNSGTGKTVVFRNNTARVDAGVIYSSTLNGLVIYGDTLFEGNQALGGSGGAICVYGMLTAKNTVFKNNSAKVYGGAVYISKSTAAYGTRFVNLADCAFESNHAGYGGALGLSATSTAYEEGGIATVSGSTFISNSADSVGGVVYAARKSKLTVTDSEFSNNTSGGESGVMYLIGKTDADIKNSVFTNNSSATHGGAFSIRSATLDLTNSIVENNQSGSNGGALYISYISSEDVNSDVTIKDSSISGNTSKKSGGAIYATRREIEGDNHTLDVINTDFSGNTAASGGGAIFLTAKTEAFLKEVSFSDNTLTSKSSKGGAIYLNGSSIEIDGGIFAKNNSRDVGGAIYMNKGAVAVLNNINASRNTAGGNGGFLYSEGGTLKMYNSNIRSNEAQYGGAMYLYTDAVSEIYSTEFKSNKATTDNGGALFIYTGNVPTLLNGNTFISNSAEGVGGAMYISGESNAKIYNTTAKKNSAANGGFLYETKAGTEVLISKLTVSENTATVGGPIIWGNTKNAILNIDKSSYTDLETEINEDYWSYAIVNALTVNDISATVPSEDKYVTTDDEEKEEAEKNPVSVEDVFKLAESSSDGIINSEYSKLPRLDNSSNFMSKEVTTFENINGNTVTVDTFVYPYRGQADNMNVGQGLLIYQAMLYKKAHPEEDVSIDIASYRFSVDAAVNINRNSRYFGYMRNLSNVEYDSYGFVKIVYLLVSAAKMGINVTAVGHVEGYPVSSSETLDTYFAKRSEMPCDPDYVTDGKVGDFLNFQHCQWTLGGDGKGGTDMMHTKMCAVSHYLDMNGVEHRNAVFSSSANLDGIRSDIQNGNWKLQTGTIVSDHEEIYNVASNYIRLVADYSYQEGIIEIQDIVNTRSAQQIDAILSGNSVPKDEQIVYIGTENDDVFELYFTPFGGSRLAWNETYNPYCKYVRELYNSEGHIFFTWNAAEYSSYAFVRQIESVISEAFHNNRDNRNVIYVNAENFDSSVYNDLEVGVDIGFKSFNKYDFNEIHNKDMQVSYVKDGQRYNVSLLNSLNVHGGSMYYQSNFCLVIKETSCANNSVFATIAKYTTKGDMSSHSFGEEKYFEGSETEHACKYIECEGCGHREIIELYHKGGGEWINLKDSIDGESGICYRNCVICGEMTETMETFGRLDTEYDADKVTGRKFTSTLNSMYTFSTKNTPRTFEATILLPKTVKERGGVIVGNNGYSDSKPINFEIHENGKPKLFYMVDGERADIQFKTDIRSNDPVHVAITVDDERAILYVDGKMLESQPVPMSLPEARNNFAVGGDYRKGNTQYFKGTIYSVNVFSDVRTSEEIERDKIYVSKDTDALEYTVYYSVEEQTTIISGEELPSGIMFDENSSYISENSYEKQINTIEAVLKLPIEHEGRGGVVFGNYDETLSDAINFEIFEKGRPRLFYVSGGTKYDVKFNTDIRSENPVYIALVTEGENINLYIDGELVETQLLPCPLPESCNSIRVGADQRKTSSQYFQGTLYALNLYADLRTTDEILSDIFAPDRTDENLLYSAVMTENKIKEGAYGQTFDEKTMGHVNCVLPAVPHTFEAVIQLPQSHSSRGGIIIGNNGGDNDIINFEIYKDGKPRFYYITNGITTDCVFETDVRSDNPVHIAVTFEDFMANLYVNGEFKESIPVDYNLGSADENYVIGGDLRLGNNQYFKGKIYSVSLFENARTEEEIKKDSRGIYGTESGLLYTVNYIEKNAHVLTTDEMHPNKSIFQEYESTEGASGLRCIGCADCGKLLYVKVTPSDNAGINYINHSTLKGLKADDMFQINSSLSATPKTVEMVVQLDETVSERAGVLFGNYDGSAKEQINYEVYNNGRPRIWFKTGGVSTSAMFGTDIRSENKVHITFTIEEFTAKLYINGKLKETAELTLMYPEAVDKYVVGGDNRIVEPQKFKGTIYSINVFDDVRTEEEILIDSYAVAGNTNGLIYSKYFKD